MYYSRSAVRYLDKMTETRAASATKTNRYLPVYSIWQRLLMNAVPLIERANHACSTIRNPSVGSTVGSNSFDQRCFSATCQPGAKSVGRMNSALQR